MDPASIAIMTAVSTGMSVLGSIQQGQAANASAQYNARVQENNAEIARRNALFASQEGAANVEKKQLETRANIGAIKSAQAASGVDIGGPSAVDVRSSASELGQLSAINIRSNAVRRAYGYETEAVGNEAQAELDRAEGKNAKTASYVNAAGTFLGQTSSAAQKGNYDAWLGSTGM